MRRVRQSVEHYQREASGWSAAYAAPTVGGQALRERLRRTQEALRGRPPGLLLDLGCGTGVVGEVLARDGWRVLGLDAAPAMVAEAARRLVAPSLGAVIGDAGQLPVRDGAVDAVVCLGVLDRLVDPDRTLREVARVLRPGGAAVLTLPNAHSPYARWSSSVWRPAVGAAKARLGRSGLDGRAHVWSRSGAVAAAEGAGLRVLSCRGYWFNLLLSPLDELAPERAARLAARLEPWHAGRAHWLGAGWVLVAVPAPGSAR